MDYELGYTPNNLKTILLKSGMTYEQVYTALGCSRRTFFYWLKPVDDDSHKPMHSKKWKEFLELMESKGVRL